jgi:hypothetical protein
MNHNDSLTILLKLLSMNYDDLHKLGIKVVYNKMIDEGYDVLGVYDNQEQNPQIMATRDGKRYVVVVRTARFPNMGILLPITAKAVKDYASTCGAICLFASVGIANGDGNTDEEMGQPNLNGNYIIRYEGLQPFPAY